jgi:hypothetical protein
MRDKIANLSVKVPIKKAGNVIVQEFVQFEVLQDSKEYILTPQLQEDELRIANLPIELRFFIENGKPVSVRGKRDGNFHVIQDAFAQLKTLQLLESS